MQLTKKKRLYRLLFTLAILICAGIVYALIYSILGFGIPCPIKTITGFDCPGCGVSRMLLSLLHLDFVSAWQANPVLLLMLPFGIYLTVKQSLRYVQLNKKSLSGPDSILVCIACVILLVFAVIRNI